jgi:hypothetical protein
VFMYCLFVTWRDRKMAFENTITERDLDRKSQYFVQGQRNDGQDYEPDLLVDGMSESILSRLFGLFGVGR